MLRGSMLGCKIVAKLTKKRWGLLKKERSSGAEQGGRSFPIHEDRSRSHDGRAATGGQAGECSERCFLRITSYVGSTGFWT